MINYHKENGLAGRKELCRRLAVLAGAAVLAFGSSFAAFAEEPVRGGDTMETAVLVPAFPEGNQSTAENAGESQNAAGTEETAGAANRIIRIEQNAASSEPQQSTGTSSGIDYSAGPGAFMQSGGSESSQSQQAEDQTGLQSNAQIYDVQNPIVQTVEKYSYDQMVRDINNLKARYGNKIQVNTIGTSLDGRAIYDCIVGNVNASKHILIQGGIHGREYLNPMLLMQQMELALANYDTGSFNGNSLSSMFSQVAVHFVPMTNPDGITISQFGPDLLNSQELKDTVSTCYVMDTAAGRTTADTAGYFSKWKANARGVDLNLNFDALWDQVSSTEFPSYSGYKGTAPGTEPEAQALMNLYHNSQYNWKAVIHYHSMGDVIYWDIAGNKVQQESSDLANLMSVVTGGYRILPSEGGGGYKDWIQLSSHPVPSVTLETGKVACPMPLSEYSTIWSQNRLTWVVTMEWVAAR